MAGGWGPRVGHDQVLLRMTQYTQIGCLFHAAIGSSAAAAAASTRTRRTGQDAGVAQLRDDVGRTDGSRLATGWVAAAGAAARGAAARRPIAIVLMSATGGEIPRRRLRLRLHLDGDGRAGGRRRAIRDRQVR